MSGSPTVPVWRNRLHTISTHVEGIRFPDTTEELDQDQEWCEVLMDDGTQQRIRFHDYDCIYNIPGLYEKLFYERLQCCSPSRMVRLLEEVRREIPEGPDRLRVLDFGAGNGMVGDELRHRDVETIVGADILLEARQAARRDRPEVYADYLAADFTSLSEAETQRLSSKGFNCLTSVAALGYGDIPPQAFLQAVDFVESPGWLAFNIKEDFLIDSDSQFSRLVRELNERRVIQIQCYRRYQHRVSLSGQPLYYVGLIALKQCPIPHDMKARW